MGRTLPTECEHGTVIDWGDFGPCVDCKDHDAVDCPNLPTCSECAPALRPDECHDPSYQRGWDQALAAFAALPTAEQMAFLGMRRSNVHEHRTGTCWRPA